MPRRRRTFIDRSRAKTFQLVHGSGDHPSDQVFVPHNHAHESTNPDGSAFPSPEGTIPVSEFHDSYDRDSYELGEYGFPDKEYDYSQHFRTIGGGGGTYMDALSGRPKPEAVASSSVSRNDKDSRPPKQQVVLRDSFTADENETVAPQKAWKNLRDIQQSLKAIEDIKRDRKANKDLDEVIAALDSDGELDLTASEADNDSNVDALDDIIRNTLMEDEDLLEDDFVAMANDDEEKADAGLDLLDGVVEEYREPRLLDEQFERFMQGFEPDTDDEEEEELRAELLEHKQRIEDCAPHFEQPAFQDLWQDEELLEELSNLQIDETEEVDGEDSETKGERNGGGDRAGEQMARTREFSEFRAAEFERGMTGLLDSYKRVSANEAFAAVDGLEGARDAIKRAEEEEEARVEFQNEVGLQESDGHDSELDSHFDELFKDKGEQWDCETILSTYSNLENHPSVIDAPSSVKRRSVKAQPIIRLDPRTQAPAEFMAGASASRPSNEAMDYGSKPDRQVNNVRTKGETKEEKRARKAEVKEAARERRALKSEMRKAFGAENVKQSKHATALGTSKVTLKF